MIKSLLFDFSYVFLFPKDKKYSGTLNGLYKQLNEQNIKYNFWDFFELNIDLLNYLNSIKIPKSIYTSGTIQNDLALKKVINPKFSQIISAEISSLPKSDPASYLQISKNLALEPKNILFIDDDINNISVAKSAGLETLQYIDNLKLFADLNYLQ